ncbi:MAG: hypothetical protein ACE5JZ_09240, partial [Kiloniellales bacterium]
NQPTPPPGHPKRTCLREAEASLRRRQAMPWVAGWGRGLVRFHSSGNLLYERRSAAPAPINQRLSPAHRIANSKTEA